MPIYFSTSCKEPISTKDQELALSFLAGRFIVLVLSDRVSISQK
jgi:hypothetical protein